MKLQAEMREGSNHMIAALWVDGFLIASFGIRRDRKSGHWHIPDQLHISERKALALADCTWSRDDLVIHLRERGFIPVDPQSLN